MKPSKNPLSSKSPWTRTAVKLACAFRPLDRLFFLFAVKQTKPLDLWRQSSKNNPIQTSNLDIRKRGFELETHFLLETRSRAKPKLCFSATLQQLIKGTRVFERMLHSTGFPAFFFFSLPTSPLKTAQISHDCGKMILIGCGEVWSNLGGNSGCVFCIVWPLEIFFWSSPGSARRLAFACTRVPALHTSLGTTCNSEIQAS